MLPEARPNDIQLLFLKVSTVITKFKNAMINVENLVESPVLGSWSTNNLGRGLFVHQEHNTGEYRKLLICTFKISKSKRHKENHGYNLKHMVKI